jgi:hypothetical protein
MEKKVFATSIIENLEHFKGSLANTHAHSHTPKKVSLV